MEFFFSCSVSSRILSATAMRYVCRCKEEMLRVVCFFVGLFNLLLFSVRTNWKALYLSISLRTHSIYQFAQSVQFCKIPSQKFHAHKWVAWFYLFAVKYSSFFFVVLHRYANACDSFLANNEILVCGNEHERKIKRATMNCTENLVHIHLFRVNACVIFSIWKHEIFRAHKRFELPDARALWVFWINRKAE